MATRGSANSNSQSGMYLRFAWEIAETNIGSNYDEIYWELTGQGGSAGYYIVSGPFYVTVGDSQYSATGRINMYPGTIVLNGRTKIYHNSDGKKNFSVSFSGAIYSYSVNSWGSGSWDLPDIPRKATITTAENFNDEGNPTITYSNLAGNNATTLQARIENSAGTLAYVDYRDISKTGNSYTFNLTNAERTVLRNACSNSNTLTVKFVIKTVIGSNTFWSTMDKTMTIVNANPVIDSSLVDYQDVNSITTALTLNNKAAIRGFSNLQITIPVAQAQKEANILKYRVQIGSAQKDVSYSDQTITTQIDHIDGSIINIYAIDTRGNSTLVTKAISKYINYKALSEYISSAVATRTGGVSQEVTLNINGQFWNSLFSETPTRGNHIKSIRYQYMKTEGDYTWHDGATLITIAYSGNNYSFSGLIEGDLGALGFDNQYSFYIKVIVEDELSITEIEYILQKASPNIALHRLGTSFGKPYNETEGGTVQIDGVNIFNAIYPVGSIYMNVTLVDPATLFGGTWSRLEDRFLLAAGQTYQAGDVGGEATHLLTTDEMPSHRHVGIYGGNGERKGGYGSTGTHTGILNENTTTEYETFTTGYTGGSQAHNNMPPYLVVYMWQRIS